jgi:pimeloyl-ACP methyl ester carboxylesterase
MYLLKRCWCCFCCPAGSSLGGWLALQLALDHPAHVCGLLLIAPALDFTETIWGGMTLQQQAVAERGGRIQIGSK